MCPDAGGMKEAVERRLKDVAGRVVERVRGGQSETPLPAELSGEPVFRSDRPWSGEKRSDVLVMVCSDARFLPHYGQFLSKSLNLNEYDVVAVPGGVQWLALPDILPKHFKVGRQVMEYLVEKHGLKRVILIAHAGCGMYKDGGMMGTLAQLATGKSVPEHQVGQMEKVSDMLRREYGVTVECYYASVSGDEVVFHGLAAEQGGGSWRD